MRLNIALRICVQSNRPYSYASRFHFVEYCFIGYDESGHCSMKPKGQNKKCALSIESFYDCCADYMYNILVLLNYLR